jgi:protein-tyrosine phosphatase
VIDIHSHVLPGLDDGPGDLEGSLAILRAMADDGVRIVVATPHVRVDYPTTPVQMRSALARVRAGVEGEGIPIDVLPGAEIAIDALAGLSADERIAFGLGGRADVLLVETPYHGWSTAVGDMVAALVASGVTPVIAHPERNPRVQERPELLAPLVRAGAVVQLTAASLDGRLGRGPAAASRTLIELGVVHVVASDAHAASIRRGGLSGVATALGDTSLARLLTSEAPQALLAGEPLPPIRSRRKGVVGRLLSPRR